MTISKLKALCLYYHVSADYIPGLPVAWTGRGKNHLTAVLY